jgi:hypothetical protein
VRPLAPLASNLETQRRHAARLAAICKDPGVLAVAVQVDVQQNRALPHKGLHILSKLVGYHPSK